MQFLPGESTGMGGRVYLVSNSTVQLNTHDLKFPLFTFITPNPSTRNVGKSIGKSKEISAGHQSYSVPSDEGLTFEI